MNRINNCVYSMGYYSTFKSKETLIHPSKWMDLEDIVLSKIRPSPKNKYYKLPVIWSSSNSDTKRRWLSGTRGGETGGLCSVHTESGKGGKILDKGDGGSVTIMFSP